MRIIKRRSFIKDFDLLDYKISLRVVQALEIFQFNPFDARLNNHKLIGDYQNCRSINVTGDFRLLFKELSNGAYELIELIRVGTHSQLYE